MFRVEGVISRKNEEKESCIVAHFNAIQLSFSIQFFVSDPFRKQSVVSYLCCVATVQQCCPCFQATAKPVTRPRPADKPWIRVRRSAAADRQLRQLRLWQHDCHRTCQQYS